MADGRLLTCLEEHEGDRCQIVDPLDGQTRVIPRIDGVASAVPLDDGHMLMLGTRVVLDLETGSTRPLPHTKHDLGSLAVVALTGGRAVFRFSDRRLCHRLLVFQGLERGFREIDAGDTGTCVEAVFDLGMDRALVARTIRGKRTEELDLVQLNLRQWTWQAGPSIPWSVPRAAFAHGDGAIVMLRDTLAKRGEALYIDRAGRGRRVATFVRDGVDLRAVRLDGRRFVFFDRAEPWLWDLTNGRSTPLPFPFPPWTNWGLFERKGRIFVLDLQKRRALVLSPLERARGSTPCADVFMFAEAVLASKKPDELSVPHVESQMASREGAECRESLEEQGRLPEMLQAPLDALEQRTTGRASAEEEIAARFLCLLMPSWSQPRVARINAGGTLSSFGKLLCEQASEQLPVIVAVRTQKDASAALTRAALPPGPQGTKLQPWVFRLVRTRKEVARVAAPLLRSAAGREAQGFYELHRQLCTPSPAGELAGACHSADASQERGGRGGDERAKLLLRFGVATGVLGGLGTLAYFTRNGDAGRVLAVGSGIVAGGALGLGVTIGVARGKPDTEGLGALLLAVPVSIAGATAGGIAAGVASKDPGAPRFAATAVPLSALWLTSVALTIDAW